jgi:hypothetical protein
VLFHPPFSGAAASLPFFRGSESFPSSGKGIPSDSFRGPLHPFIFSGLIVLSQQSFHPPVPLYPFLLGLYINITNLEGVYSIRHFQGAAASFLFFRGSESVTSGGWIPSAPFREPLHPFFFSGAPSPFPAVGGHYPPLSGGRCILSFFQGLRVLS